MAKFDQFGSAAPGLGGSTRDCLRYEAMLADVIDGTLSGDEQAAFERHRETCDSCSEMLKDAQRGAAWLAMLKPNPPQPSATLVDRILAETSVRAAAETEAVRAAQRAAAEAASLLGSAKLASAKPAIPGGLPTGAPESGKVLAFRTRVPAVLHPAFHTVLQPRFAMTAAMAFFSVALTLNLTGVHLSDLHARDLRPTSLRRSFYEANAHVVRYYENLRVVYELESRVRDLQHATDADPATAPTRPDADPAKPEAQPNPQPDKTNSPASAPQSRPAGKPHSGLSSGSQDRGRDAGALHLGNGTGDSRLARRHTTVNSPQGAILPVSSSHLSPDRQKRGLA